MLVTKKNILIVEDEENISELIRFNLSKEGFQTTCTASGEEAIKIARSKTPDLVLLDLMLPDMDGLEICRVLKSHKSTAHIPVIMVTAKGEEADIVTGLELGADDYITKPFSPRVLVTRIKSVFRKKSPVQQEEEKVIRAKDITIHPGRHEVLIKNQPVELTFTEFRILHLLAARPGWVFSRDQIVEGVRGEDFAVTDRSVDFQIVGLRKKLGSCAKMIKTVRGVGYKFSG